MNLQVFGRRTFLKQAGAALAGLAGLTTGWLRLSAQDGGEYPIDEECERILEAFETFEPERLLKMPECLYSVSKNMNGEILRQEVAELQCNDPRTGDDCYTLHTIHELNMTVQSNSGACESDPSINFLGDTFVATLVFRHIEDGNQRGYHQGKFEWVGSNSHVVGMMSGMFNTRADRPSGNCEAFNWGEGKLEGFVVDGEMTGCCVRGTYIIQIDPGEEGVDGVVNLQFEGMIFCRCE